VKRGGQGEAGSRCGRPRSHRGGRARPVKRGGHGAGGGRRGPRRSRGRRPGPVFAPGLSRGHSEAGIGRRDDDGWERSRATAAGGRRCRLKAVSVDLIRAGRGEPLAGRRRTRAGRGGHGGGGAQERRWRRQVGEDLGF
jgi:hypothetical protein